MESMDGTRQPKITANQLPNFRLPVSIKNTKQPPQGKMNLLRAQDRCVQGNMNLRRAQDRCQLRMPYAAATLGTSSLRTTDFLFDSGSSTHLVGGGIALYDAELAIDYNVQLAAGTAPVHSIGYLDILIPSRPCKVTLTLSNVIRVPSASLNLISVSKVATMPGVDVSINFYATRARIVIGGNAIDILLHNGTYIASTTILRPIHLSTAAASHDLSQEESSVTTHASIEEELDALVFPNEPRLEIPTPMLSPTTSTSLSPPTSLSPDVITVLDLHSFYNHKNLRELQRLTRAGLLPDLPEELRINLLRTRKLSCPACTLGKSTLSSGSKVPSSTPSLPGQRAHSDYAGPFITSHRGDRFAQAFTDSSSGFTFLEFHPDRTSARALFGLQLYRIWVKTHSTHALHTVTTDGGELTSRQCRLFCRRAAINLQITAPYKSSQNGRAERLWRTLKSLTVVLLHQSGLPTRFWPLAMSCIIFQRNRLPTKGNTITPFEKFYGRPPPPTAPFLPFGCKVFASKPTVQHRTLGTKAAYFLHVGSADKLQYQLYNPQTGSVVTRAAADVTPFPSVFPLISDSDSSSPSPTPTISVPLYVHSQPAASAPNVDMSSPLEVHDIDHDASSSVHDELVPDDIDDLVSEDLVSSSPDSSIVQPVIPSNRYSRRIRTPALPHNVSSHEYQAQLEHDRQRLAQLNPFCRCFS